MGFWLDYLPIYFISTFSLKGYVHNLLCSLHIFTVTSKVGLRTQHCGPWVHDLQRCSEKLDGSFSQISGFNENMCHFDISCSVQFVSVTQLCLTLCEPMGCSTPGFPVHHQPLELAPTHVHQVRDAIQPSYPLLSPPPPGRVFLICRSSTGCLYLPVISFCYCFFSMLDHREFISSCCYKSSSPNSAFCIISESMDQFSSCGELYLFCCMPGNSNWEICMLILGF